MFRTCLQISLIMWYDNTQDEFVSGSTEADCHFNFTKIQNM